MKFIIFVIDDFAGLADAGEMAAIDAFNDALQANGQWITATGIASRERATLIDNRGGANLVQLGTSLQVGDVYSGFWLIEAADAATAHELALAGSLACNRRVELRPYL